MAAKPFTIVGEPIRPLTVDEIVRKYHIPASEVASARRFVSRSNQRGASLLKSAPRKTRGTSSRTK
jgi:hypothetical protein